MDDYVWHFDIDEVEVDNLSGFANAIYKIIDSN